MTFGISRANLAHEHEALHQNCFDVDKRIST